ncbi:MAG: hypothetical protein ACRDK2_08790 [Solirubrobacteraceae bacterium]
MTLLVRSEIESSKTLRVVPTALGYPDRTQWESTVEEQTNLIMARRPRHWRMSTSTGCVLERYGEVDTTWVLYHRHWRYRGELLGHPFRGCSSTSKCRHDHLEHLVMLRSIRRNAAVQIPPR